MRVAQRRFTAHSASVSPRNACSMVKSSSAPRDGRQKVREKINLYINFCGAWDVKYWRASVYADLENINLCADLGVCDCGGRCAEGEASTGGTNASILVKLRTKLVGGGLGLKGKSSRLF